MDPFRELKPLQSSSRFLETKNIIKNTKAKGGGHEKEENICSVHGKAKKQKEDKDQQSCQKIATEMSSRGRRYSKTIDLSQKV